MLIADTGKMPITLWLPPIVIACVWALGHYVKPVDSGHFVGGLIYWRPVNPAAFDGRVRIQIIRSA